MGFSLSFGEKYVITSGSGRVLERIYKNKPVWQPNMKSAKTFNSYQAAHNCLHSNQITGSVSQVKDIAEPFYLVTRLSDSPKEIFCDIIWVHNKAVLDLPGYYRDREAAQKALDNIKQEILREYQDLIMIFKDLVLPEMT